MEIPYTGTLPTKEQFKELFDLDSYSDLTSTKKGKLQSLLENYSSLSTNFEIIKLNVHTDLDYPYLKENSVIPNFPQGVMSVFRTIKMLDSNSEQE